MFGVVMSGVMSGPLENFSFRVETLRMRRSFVDDLISGRDSKFLDLLAIIQ
jgi:hypothetical protein